MLALGSFLILIQLICIKSEIKSDLGDLAIKIVNTRAAEVPQINSDDFMNGLFTKIESSIGSDKAVTVGCTETITKRNDLKQAKMLVSFKIDIFYL